MQPQTTQQQQAQDDGGFLLYKEEIKRVFDSMKKRYPHIHAMFMEAPREVCYLRQLNEDRFPETFEYSVAEFFEEYDALTPHRDFFIVQVGYYLPGENEDFPDMEYDGFEITGRIKIEHDDPIRFSAQALLDNFRPMLVNWCRNALLQNRPLLVIQRLIDKYSLDSTAAENLIPLLNECNAKALAQLQQQYDMLRAIDCIRK